MDDDDFDDFFDPDSFLCFERTSNSEAPQKPFTSTTFSLDLSPSATLRWENVCIELDALIKDGYKIVFDFDFGFSRPDFKGFLHQNYFQTCRFAVDHFLSELLPQYETHCIGAIVAKVDDPALLHNPLREQFLDYLDRLSSLMPANFERFLLIKTAQDPFECCQELHSELFQGFTLALDSCPYCTSHIVWKTGKRLSGYIGRALIDVVQAPNIGLLIPNDENAFETVKHAFTQVSSPYKVIAENALTHAWEGIDELYLPSWQFSKTTNRALDGFIAAGGVIRQLT